MKHKYVMKISICITNHNQNDIVSQTIKLLNQQYQKPELIFVCSDDRIFQTKDENVVCINNKKNKGRCNNKNAVIKEFLDSESDALIFIDGDTYPKNNDFIIKYEDYFEHFDLVFGTKEHTSPNGLKKPPSDLLAANMDNLWNHKPLNYDDFRVVKDAVSTWHNTFKFNEKLDLMLTGLISWGGNFGITRKGLLTYLDFVEKHYGKRELFDSKANKGGWSYEDTAMGIDALFAGLNIWISDDMKVVHKSHERTDDLFDHVASKHLIQERVRNLTTSTKVKDKVYTSLMILFGTYILGLITGLVTMAITLS